MGKRCTTIQRLSACVEELPVFSSWCRVLFWVTRDSFPLRLSFIVHTRFKFTPISTRLSEVRALIVVLVYFPRCRSPEFLVSTSVVVLGKGWSPRTQGVMVSGWVPCKWFLCNPRSRVNLWPSHCCLFCEGREFFEYPFTNLSVVCSFYRELLTTSIYKGVP